MRNGGQDRFDAAAEEAPARRRGPGAGCLFPSPRQAGRAAVRVQGLQAEPEFAEWVEKNLTLGRRSDALTLQLLVRRSVPAERESGGRHRARARRGLAACERAQSR